MYPKQTASVISPYLSSKLKLLSFILIILVLYIHSGFHADEIGNMPVNSFIQGIISDKIGRVAVPLFFIISGYLFFFSLRGDNLIDSFRSKIKSRISSLIIPYVIGCLFCVCFFLVLERIPFLKKYLNSSVGVALSGTWLNTLGNVFWKNNGANSPLAFHLWFLRDLIILVFGSPVIFYGIRYMRWFFVMVVLVIASFHTYNPQSFFLSVFWFSLGASIALEKLNVELKISQLLRLGVLLLFITLIFVEQVYKISWNTFGTVIVLIFSVVNIWLLYDFLFDRKTSAITVAPFFTAYTFFIYIYHEPSINIVRKVIILVLGKGSSQYLISYLFSPLLFAVIAVTIGGCLRKGLPSVFSLITGGRG